MVSLNRHQIVLIATMLEQFEYSYKMTYRLSQGWH